MVSEQRKETKELRKQIETLASIIDSMAQKQDLLIQKVGYPKPEPVVKKEEPDKIMVKYEQHSDFKCNSCGAIFSKGVVNKEENKYICNECLRRGKTQEPESQKEIKAVQKSIPIQALSEEEEAQQKAMWGNKEEVINPMRVPKQAIEEIAKFENKTPEQAQRDMDEDFHQAREEADVMQWQNISEAFLCHNCQGKTHNGFMKLGTKLCPTCKDKIESNESEDFDANQKDRSDVNEFVPPPESQPLRSIEDINSEDVSF